jgi:hypothetical protein
MNHVLYKDNFYIRHFIEWLDSSISDTEEWLAVYAAIYDLLADQPDLIDDCSWSTLRLIAGV